MPKGKKISRPKAQAPKGFRDYFGLEVSQRSKILAQITSVYDLYGFDPLESSAIETVEALGKFLPDVDRPNAGVFAWQEEESDWVALRYDLTAPLARIYAQYRAHLPTPYRRYSTGPVWRNEKPGPGRYRQFYQCDADTVGTASIAADAEVCMMLSDVLERVGIPIGDYIIRLNNRKVLDGILEIVRVHSQAQREAVLRTIDKFDKLGKAGVQALLGKGRLDSSGAYIDGVGLSEMQSATIIAYLTAMSTSMAKTFCNLRTSVAGSKVGQAGVDELEAIATLLDGGGYGTEKITVDPSIVRGLGYYTGPVFEAELTFELLDEKGCRRQFGSVAGGGRYDDLVKRFTGQEVPATGISIGVDRLLAALRENGRISMQPKGPVLVTVMDRERMADYHIMVSELRAAGIRAEVYLGNPKNFGNQLKYADKRRSALAIIEGEIEKERNIIQIKDLNLGSEMSQKATLKEWKKNPAQREFARSDLVQVVRSMLKGII